MLLTEVHNADVAELVDALDSKSSFFGSVGSIPTIGTKLKRDLGLFLFFENTNTC